MYFQVSWKGKFFKFDRGYKKDTNIYAIKSKSIGL
jgi:hypothetical protein